MTPGTLTLTEARKLATSYAVDLAGTPNRITLIPRAHGVGQLLNGIFSFDGDTLTLCSIPKSTASLPRHWRPKRVTDIYT